MPAQAENAVKIPVSVQGRREGGAGGKSGQT